jgi:RNA polymerase sigma-70 factor (ECF subfamily)
LLSGQIDPNLLNHSLLSGDYISDPTNSLSATALEHELLQRVVGRDEDAFADLYHRFSTMLHAYLVQLVLDPTVAEDLIQEVFLAVWNGASRFRGHSTVKTWMYKIAHYQAVSWLRRNARGPASSVDERASTVDLLDQTHDHWVRDQVRQALRQLSPDHRAVVELTFYHGLSYQEIAEVLSCPVGTVKSRMSYARRYLIQHLDDAGLKPER